MAASGMEETVMDKKHAIPYAGDRPRGKKRVLERYNALKLGWLHDSIHFILLSLALFILFRYVIGFAIVGGDSMLPNLRDGEMVV